MYSSMHGVAKSAYAITFGDPEPAPAKACVHLDAKNFLVSRHCHEHHHHCAFSITEDLPHLISNLTMLAQ
jgi:hypothetical protein